ncbi:phage antirepressor KilAC domain-containing protein [Sphingomonas sp. UYP23]
MEAEPVPRSASLRQPRLVAGGARSSLGRHASKAGKLLDLSHRRVRLRSGRQAMGATHMTDLLSGVVTFGGQHLVIAAAAPPRMSSREIADLVGSRHDKVKQSIERLVERGTIVQPPMGDEPESDALGRTRLTRVYLIGKRDSYVIVAQLSPEFTAHLVDRWQELEASRLPEALPHDFPSALRALADKTEREQQLIAERRADAPKVAFAEQVATAPDSVTLGQGAKIFDTGRNRFCQWLREIAWLTRTNEPYQDKINSGYLDVKISNWDHPERGLQRAVTALITGKGLAKLHTLWTAARRQPDLPPPNGS